MSEEDRKLQKHLVDEMMKVSETNPDVMFYMESLMKKYEELEQKVEQLEERCEYLERSNNRREDEIIELRDENVDLASKNNQLENIRKEAIEYVENNWITYNDSKNFTEFNEELPVFIKEINILLNILNKGSKNDSF